MAKRKKLSNGKSKRLFSGTAGVHRKNGLSSMPMRGGIRL